MLAKLGEIGLELLDAKAQRSNFALQPTLREPLRRATHKAHLKRHSFKSVLSLAAIMFVLSDPTAKLQLVGICTGLINGGLPPTAD